MGSRKPKENSCGQRTNSNGNFIEYLVPALQVTTIFCALHGFISNEVKFPVNPQRELHLVRSLMFYSILCGSTLFLYIKETIFSCRTISRVLLFRDPARPARCSREIFLLREPLGAAGPRHHCITVWVCPRPPSGVGHQILSLTTIRLASRHIRPPLSSTPQPHPACRNSLPRIGDSVACTHSLVHASEIRARTLQVR